MELKAGRGEVAVTRHGRQTPRMHPALKVKGRRREAPQAILVDGKAPPVGVGCNASLNRGVLLLQLLEPVRALSRQ